MDDDQTCPEQVLLVQMERAFRGPTHEGVRTLDWQPQMNRVLQCVRDNDPLIIAMRAEVDRLRHDIERHVAICSEQATEIERLRDDVATTTGLLVRANDEIERLTARVHDLENELAAGVHTCGPTCRKTRACAARADLREENERLCAHVAALQARVDALMLEFCPDEMSEQQIETWARHQRPTTADVTAAVLAAGSDRCNPKR